MYAVAAAMAPIAGQNFGAGNYVRLLRSTRFCLMLAGVYTVGSIAVVYWLSPPIAELFSSVPAIQEHIISYLRISSMGYGLFGLTRVVGSIFNAVRAPRNAVVLHLLQTFAALLFTFVGVRVSGFSGGVTALALVYCFGGVLSYLYLELHLFQLTKTRQR